MIDYIKLNISYDKLSIINNPILSFCRPINEDTGEIEDDKWRSSEYNNMRFRFKGKYMELNGSLHKYSNEDMQNFNDFGYSDLVSTINNFYSKFSINQRMAKILNLEFGVNLIVPFNINKFLKEQIINYKGQSKSKASTFGGRGTLVEFELSDYIIKIYNKGLQYHLDNNILRFEVRTKKTEFIKTTGIKTLVDLIDKDKLQKLKTILQHVFNGLLITDTIDDSAFNSKDKLLYHQGTNPNYWSTMKPDSNNYSGGNRNPAYQSDRQRYYTKLKEFKELLNKYNLTETKDFLMRAIGEKWDYLMSY